MVIEDIKQVNNFWSSYLEAALLMMRFYDICKHYVFIAETKINK